MESHLQDGGQVEAQQNRPAGAVLGMLAAAVGVPALVCLLYGVQFGRPSWGLLGLAGALHGAVLVRASLAARRPAAEAEAPDSPYADWVAGPLAVLGALWGLAAPVEAVRTEVPAALLGGVMVGALGSAGAGRYAADTPSLPRREAIGYGARFAVWAAALVLAEHTVGAMGWPLGWFTDALTTFGHGLVLTVGLQTLFDAWRGRRPVGGSFLMPWLFARWNPVASLGDALQAGLGVDLRTTWALQFLRSAVAPMSLAVLGLGWLCTSLVRVGPEEVAIHERFGVPLSREAVGPGLYVVAPWPIDRMRRVPSQRVLTMLVGEEEEEEEGHHEGPEDTLWARMHAEEEYTLLLGDGHDLVTIDGLLHYRISDPYTYLYGCQNPEEGLQAAAYEALTRRTVGRSLDGVLSQNLSLFAEEVVADIAARAEVLDLGVTPVSFTLKGLHPPFAVAKDYQAVVSAQIAQETSVIRAKTYRAGALPSVHSDAKAQVDDALAEQATSRAAAVGESQAFRSLVERYDAHPELFRYRRRMEALERQLLGRDLTVIDRRFEAQGGQLWIQK